MSIGRPPFPTAIRIFAVLLILVWWSLLPEPLKGRVATFGFLHRLSHIAAFCIGFLIAASSLKNSFLTVILALLLAAAGVTLEFLQSVVYGNYREYWDMRDDAWGVALGWLLQRFMIALKGKHTFLKR